MFPNGEEVKKRRKELNISGVDFADMVGASRQHLTRFESGKGNVSPEILDKMCEVLGLTKKSRKTNKVPLVARVAEMKASIESGAISLGEQIELAEGILEDAREEGDELALGESMLALTQLYRLDKRFGDATAVGVRCIDIFVRSGDSISWSTASFELANTHYDRGNYAMALESFRIIEQRLNEERYIGPLLPRLYTAIALSSVAIEDSATMREYAEKCEEWLELVLPSKRNQHTATNQYLLGRSAMLDGRFQDAKRAFETAINYYTLENDNVAVLRMRNNLAEASYLAGDLDVAKTIACEVLAMKLSYEYTSASVVETELLLAEVAYAKKDYVDAVDMCHQILEKVDIEETRYARTKRLLAKVSYIEGDTDKFNVLMAEAINSLTHKAHLPLQIEIVREYMVANHLPLKLAI